MSRAGEGDDGGDGSRDIFDLLWLVGKGAAGSALEFPGELLYRPPAGDDTAGAAGAVPRADVVQALALAV
jgi:hypothetical protein